MDVREKLLGLIAKAKYICANDYSDHTEDEYIADTLLDNGVTVQECGYWVSLTDCANAGVYCSVCHKNVYKEDYSWCNRKKLRSDYCPHCGAKMIPHPPRGENDG